jgi:tRNA dimethylallyltransferase
LPRATDVIAVVGATATGKSDVALALAEMLGGEIINSDSMQFYRGMDIGTAKLSVAERRGIPHHQLDWLEVNQDASVKAFQERARADVDAIHARGARAICVGGSGLYLRALLDHFDFPDTDPVVRALLEERAAQEGPGLLHRELAALDPQAARKIDAKNSKRIVRALEIIELTGAPMTSSLPVRTYVRPAIQVGLRLDYQALDPRIETRVDRMWEQDLPAEVRDLVHRGLREGVTAQRAVGYAETLEYLDGARDAAATTDLIKQRTRRLARKQHKWFGPDDRVCWIEAPRDGDDVSRAAADAMRVIESQAVS